MNLCLRVCCSMVGLMWAMNGVAKETRNPVTSFKATKVTESISMLQAMGGNVGVLHGSQGVLLIDNSFAHLSDALKEALEPFGGTDKLKYIINTHWHGDHTQGNHNMGKFAPIVAHDNVRARLMTKNEIKLFKMVSDPYPDHAVPSLTYSSTMHMHINGEKVRLLHLPNGHTDGDTVVFFSKANVVHTGDYFFNGFFPFVDIDHGGNVVNMAKNITTLLAMINEDATIIPGHGPLAKKPDLVAFRDMLQGSATEVKAMMDKGMSLQAIQKKGLSEKWDAWGNGFMKEPIWISIVHASLTKHK